MTFLQMYPLTPAMAVWSTIHWSPKRMLFCVFALALVFCFFSFLLWRLPVQAWFREPIERSGKCPGCGSTDVRPSFFESGIDRVRKRLGLVAFRCRGCTHRFISRCSEDVRGKLFSDVEEGVYF